MIGLRREERIPLELPVRVWGMDSNKKPFLQTATTCDVTRTGACIGGLTTTVPQGEIIGIQHGDVKTRCKICWIGESGTRREGQIGIRTLEAEKYLWGLALATVKTTPQAAAPAQGRRVYERLACTGKVEVRREGATHALWGTLSDISVTGCYVETIDPLPRSTHAQFIIRADGLDIDIHAIGEVRVAHTMVGMGVVFTQMSVEDRSRLQDFTDHIKGIKKAAPAAPQISADAPGVQRPAIAATLDQASASLRELNDALAQSKLDVRIVEELRTSIEHARQMICTAQQCVDLQLQGCDQFGVLSQIPAKRIEQASRLAQELANDLDSSEIGIDTEGLDRLFVRISKLSQRLGKIFRTVEQETQ